VIVVVALIGGIGIYRALSTGSATGLSWKSGVSYPDAPGYTAAAQAEAAQAFGSWRGQAVGVAVAYPARGTWADFTQVNGFYRTWARQPYTKAFAIPLFPDDAGATIEGCISGSYDGYWRTFADTMNSTGLTAQDTIIRLGWEFNQSTQWGSPAQFAACFRQIQSTVSAIAPGLVWDWNVSRGASAQMPGNSVLQAYPGNQYVDIIGVDSYDDWPAANTSGGWQEQLNGPYGLNYWLSFAKAHGKLFSVPEWGVASGDMFPGHEGGDDPAYITDMYDFFAANKASMAFESYFNDGGTSIYDPVQNPQASAEYLRLWR
jgi:Glycosyl hydrolase family 26